MADGRYCTYEDVEYMDGADAELIPDMPPAAPSDLGKISISGAL